MVLFFKILAKKNDYIVQYPKSQVPALSLTCDFGYRWMPNSNQNHTIPNVAIFSKSGNWPILSNQNLNGTIRERERERERLSEVKWQHILDNNDANDECIPLKKCTIKRKKHTLYVMWITIEVCWRASIRKINYIQTIYPFTNQRKLTKI